MRGSMIGENALAKPDELTSTERLLELIRNEQPPDPEPIAAKTTGGRLRTFLADSLPLARQGMSIGVDLGHEDLKLVKVNRVSDRKVELVDF
ncbi:MAG TPA: hypothetical protein VLT56_11130 [Desulfobacterales bacterium]|nr:hypothetical protein [Desulfobacterales bacterium]